jgi:S-formylglutathione hydrolase FrmB
VLRSYTRAAALGALASLGVGCSAVHGAIHALRGGGEGTCIDGPTFSGNHGPIIEGLIPARHIRTPIHYALAVPRTMDPHTVERVVYLLPERGGNAHDAITALGYGETAQHLMRAGTAPFAVLAMDAGESYFHPRTSGEDRLDIVVNDLPVLARSLLSPHISYEAIVGISMGGYGALLAAEQNPHRYRAVAVGGPALFQSFREEDRAIGDGFDNAAQFATYDVIAHAAKLATTPVRVRVGSGDPFLANVKAFAKVAPHADVSYIEHGCHDDGFWRASTHDLLSFASAPPSKPRG